MRRTTKTLSWLQPKFRDLEPGKYELRCVWTDTDSSVSGAGDWTGELSTPELEFTLGGLNGSRVSDSMGDGVSAAALATNSDTAGADYGEFATNLIFTPPSTMPEGHIRSQDLKANTVTVNLGSAQGVKVGYAYQVYRKTDQGDGVKGVIGAIKITEVQTTTSTAEVLSMQFVDEFQRTDRVRRPMFYSYKSDKVHIHVSVTKQFREQPALLKRAFAPLQALIGSRGLITVGGGDGAHADCRVSIHPPTKYDPEFVQSIADYLKTQKEIAFVEVTIVPHKQSNDGAMFGDPAAGWIQQRCRTT